MSDILERAKDAASIEYAPGISYDDWQALVRELIAEVERLRSHHIQIMGKIRAWILNDCAEVCRGFDWRDEEISRQREEIDAKDARIKELESEITAWVADRDSWIGRYEAVRKEKDARIADQEAYIERLEAAFLKLYVNQLVGCNMPREVAEKHAREALERIKELEAEVDSMDENLVRGGDEGCPKHV